MITDCYCSYYEVDLSTIGENIKKIQKYINNTKIIPVLKADAYGFGQKEIATYLYENFNISVFACSQIIEADVLRQAGIDTPIMILGAVLPFHFEYAVKNDYIIPIFTKKGVEDLNNAAISQNKKALCQIKIETGMNRIGVAPNEDLNELLKALSKADAVEVVGAYTHFVQAEYRDDDFTKKQYCLYKLALSQIEAFGIKLLYTHCCNTCSSEWFTEARDDCSHIRIGSLLFGYSDIEDKTNPMKVKESLSFRSYISHIVSLKKGETAGYGKFFKAQRDTVLAIAPVGFADGVQNVLAKHNAPVLINGERTHYVDTCMDQCFIDVTDIKCAIGDEVTIFGFSKYGQALSPQEFAFLGQIYTSYTSVKGLRVKRLYKP